MTVYGVVLALGVLGAVPGPVTTVAEWRGLPTFMVDGEPHMSTSFETYVPTTRHFRQMSRAGATVFGFPTNCGEEPYWHSTPTWVGPGVWDFSELDETVARILAADPDALLMPRINVSEPEWWRNAHPDELMVYDDGSVDFLRPYRLWPAKASRTIASMASLKWREDMAASLRRLIEHMQSAPYAEHIFSYQIYGQATEEWYHYTSGGGQLGDYSVHAREAFRAWLGRKYGTDAALSAAWGRPSRIGEAAIPTKARRQAGRGERAFRDPATEMDVIDFYQFWNEIIPECIDYFCGVAREASGGTKAVGAFYAYMFEFGGRPETGHMAVGKLLESDNVDYVVVTASYGSRQLGTGGSILRSPHTSLRLHGKLWYEDNDTVSFLFPEVATRIGDAEWERSKVVLAATDTAEESRWIYLRGAGFVLGSGLYQALFDLHGGYFDHPALLETVSDIYRVFRESADHDRTSCAEILVVADEASTRYCTATSALNHQNLYDPPYRLIKCGASYDCVYVDDLHLLDTTPYKLVVVLNGYCLDARERTLLQEKVMGGGRTVLWAGYPGLFEPGRPSDAGMGALPGIALDTDPAAPIEAARLRVVGATPEGRTLLEAGVETMGPEAPAGPRVRVEAPGAAVVAEYAASGKPALVYARQDDWTSWYAPTASLPAAFYRVLAKAAGVHVYNDRDDTLYVSQSYLTVNADGEGERVFTFPGAVNVYDAVSGECQARATRRHILHLRDKETVILRIERLD